MVWSEDVKRIVELLNVPEKVRLNDMMPPKFVSVDEEKRELTVAFDIEKWMENSRNELHGGICCTAFDLTTGIASAPYSMSATQESTAGDERFFKHMKYPRIATVDMNINFISRVEGEGNRLILTVRVVKPGMTLVRLSGEAYSEHSGKLAATCTATYAILRDVKK